MTVIKNIPKFGFGTAFEIGTGDRKISEQDFKNLIHRAVELGCRHFDCAPLYGTQRLVGDVLKKVFHSIPRSEFFITSKLPINMMHEENIDKSLKNTLTELKLSYLDLFLIHAPFATKYVTDVEMYPLDSDGNLLIDETDNLLESAWKKLVNLKQKGLVKYIGLSNVNVEQLDRLNKIHQVDVAQNEYHLYNQDREFFDYCDEIDVHYEAYAGFGCPPKAKQENKPTFKDDPTVTRIARENNLTNAQVIIQWLHQQPISYVIRSDDLSQLEENLKATLNKNMCINDMIHLDCLNQNTRLYLFDSNKDVEKHREYPFKKTTQ